MFDIQNVTIVAKDDHWKHELGDLCTFGIEPMLKLAGISFEDGSQNRYGRKKCKDYQVQPGIKEQTQS